MFDQKKVLFVQNYTLNCNEATWRLSAVANDQGDALYLLNDSPLKKNPDWQEYAKVRVDTSNVLPSVLVAL